MADPYWANTVLLCPFDADFADRSDIRHTVTLTGAAQSAAQSKFGGGSLRVGTVPNSSARALVSGGSAADWQFGAGPFTVEAWCYFTDNTSSSIMRIVGQQTSANNATWVFRWYANTLGFVYSTNGSTQGTITSVSWVPNLNQWYHLACDRDASGDLRMYVDGVVKYGPTALNVAFFNATGDGIIGNDSNFSANFVGYLDDVRVTKGVARYGGAFTPPASAFEIGPIGLATAITEAEDLPWTQRTLPVNTWWMEVAYGNGRFVAITYNNNVSAASTDGITWSQGALPSTAAWRRVAYGNGVFVAVATTSSNSAATSVDGITWTAQTLPATGNWNILTYGAGVFVAAISSSTTAATSPDGVTWTLRTLPASAIWQSITFGNNTFVAVSQSTTAATSPDGITWTQRTLPHTNSFGVAFGNGVFVAVKSGANVAATSPDGITWTPQTLPANVGWQGVAFGNGLFVAIATGPSATAASSTDGVTWTLRTLPASRNWYGVAYGAGLWVTVGQGTNQANTAPGGIAWTRGRDMASTIAEVEDYRWVSRTTPVGGNWWPVAYGNGVFVTASYNESTALSSPDGVTWTQRTMPATALWRAIAFGNNTFVAVAYTSAIAATSPDGVTWTQQALPSSTDWLGVAYGNSTFVAVARNSNKAATSPDGITWTARTLTQTGGWNALCFGNGVFVTFCTQSTVAATSPDGITWTARTLPSAVPYWSAVAYGNGTFVAISGGGNVSDIAATSPDGITWTQRTLPIATGWYAITFGGGVFMATSSGPVAALSADGVNWTLHWFPSSGGQRGVAYGNGAFISPRYGTNAAYRFVYPLQGWPARIEDAYWDSVVLLLDFDEPSPVRDPIDKSGRGHSCIKSGSTGGISSTPTKFGAYSLKPQSNTTFGTSGQLRICDNLGDFDFDNSPFTAEAWIYLTSGIAPSNRQVILAHGWGYGASNMDGWSLHVEPSTGNLGFFFRTTSSGTSKGASYAVTLANNQWYHVAVDRDASNVFRVYVDGHKIGNFTETGTFLASATVMEVGNDRASLSAFIGYIDEVRITKGVARYATDVDFTPAGSPFKISKTLKAVIADTEARPDPYWQNVVLALDGESATDLSDSRHAVDLTAGSGGPSISTAQKKFGASSYLIKATATYDYNKIQVWGAISDWWFGTGPFTIELWVNFLDVSTTQAQTLICVGYGGDCAFRLNRDITTGNLAWSYGDASGALTLTNSPTYGNWVPNIGQWYHLAVERDAANVCRLYVDGTVVGAAPAHTYDYWKANKPLCVGNQTESYNPVGGYIDEVRITKGVARYVGPAFTVPTQPFDASDPYFSIVTFLGHFDTDTPTDVSYNQRSITLTSPAVVSAEQAKFGGKSLKVATAAGGTGKATVNGSAVDCQFGANPFTIECWVYFLNAGTVVNHQHILTHWHIAANQRGWMFRREGTNNNFAFYYTTDGATGVSPLYLPNWQPPAGQWIHLAVDRSAGNIFRLYIDGVTVVTLAPGNVSIFASNQDLMIGNDIEIGSRSFPGFIDEVRITKGVARYQGRVFTPPSASVFAERTIAAANVGRGLAASVAETETVGAAFKVLRAYATNIFDRETLTFGLQKPGRASLDADAAALAARSVQASIDAIASQAFTLGLDGDAVAQVLRTAVVEGDVAVINQVAQQIGADAVALKQPIVLVTELVGKREYAVSLEGRWEN